MKSTLISIATAGFSSWVLFTSVEERLSKHVNEVLQNQFDLLQEEINTLKDEIQIFSIHRELGNNKKKKKPTVDVTGVNNRLKKLEGALACIAPTSNANDLYFTGCNVHIRNGNSVTESKDGKGNLIIGFNEKKDFCASCVRDGSHNLIVGSGHEYRSFGGIVAGLENKILAGATFSTVTGGRRNVVAGGQFGFVGGGYKNSIAGGLYGSISGGESNIADAKSASISGGHMNRVDGEGGSVSGGSGCLVLEAGKYGSISGGESNIVQAQSGSITGGYGNDVKSKFGVIVGGDTNLVEKDTACILGGFNQEISSSSPPYATIPVISGGLVIPSEPPESSVSDSWNWGESSSFSQSSST